MAVACFADFYRPTAYNRVINRFGGGCRVFRFSWFCRTHFTLFIDAHSSGCGLDNRGERLGMARLVVCLGLGAVV